MIRRKCIPQRKATLVQKLMIIHEKWLPAEFFWHWTSVSFHHNFISGFQRTLRIGDQCVSSGDDVSQSQNWMEMCWAGLPIVLCDERVYVGHTHIKPHTHTRTHGHAVFYSLDWFHTVLTTHIKSVHTATSKLTCTFDYRQLWTMHGI